MSPQTAQKRVAPSPNEVSFEVLRICRNALDLPELGLDDNFFQLGADSLTCALVSAELEGLFDVHMSPIEVYENPSCAMLSRCVVSTLERESHSLAAVPRGLGGQTKAEMSDTQQRIFKLDSQGVPWVVQWCFLVEGSIEPAKLSAALDQVVALHSVLRSKFYQEGGSFFQESFPPRTDLLELRRRSSPLGDVSRRADVDSLLAPDHEARPLSPSEGRNLQVRLEVFADRKALLLIRQHHIVTDGWSMRIFAQDLSNAYNSLVGGGDPASSIEARGQFCDYVGWVRSFHRSDLGLKYQDYWRRRTEGYRSPPLSSFDFFRPNGASGSNERDFMLVELRGGRLEEIQDFVVRESISVFGFLTGIFLCALYRHSGNLDLVVNSATAARPLKVFNDGIGPYYRSLPIRYRIDEDATLAAYLKAVSRTILEAVSHDIVPDAVLAEGLGYDLGLGTQFIFSNLLQMPSLDLAHCACRPLNMEMVPLKQALLSGNVYLEEGAVYVGFRYNVEKTDSAAMERFTESYRDILNRCLRTGARDRLKTLRVRGRSHVHA